MLSANIPSTWMKKRCDFERTFTVLFDFYKENLTCFTIFCDKNMDFYNE